jgi:hypothetical protein
MVFKPPAKRGLNGGFLRFADAQQRITALVTIFCP